MPNNEEDKESGTRTCWQHKSHAACPTTRRTRKAVQGRAGNTKVTRHAQQRGGQGKRYNDVLATQKSRGMPNNEEDKESGTRTCWQHKSHAACPTTRRTRKAVQGRAGNTKVTRHAQQRGGQGKRYKDVLATQKSRGMPNNEEDKESGIRTCWQHQSHAACPTTRRTRKAVQGRAANTKVTRHAQQRGGQGKRHKDVLATQKSRGMPNNEEDKDSGTRTCWQHKSHAACPTTRRRTRKAVQGRAGNTNITRHAQQRGGQGKRYKDVLATQKSRGMPNNEEDKESGTRTCWQHKSHSACPTTLREHMEDTLIRPDLPSLTHFA